MSWNGSGTFNRLFSWVADAAAGLDILASRMDSDTNNIASNGFGNCLTRDGQGQPTANLPMAGFRHTGVQNAVNRSDYAAFGQVQDGLPNWTIAGGSADAITATFTPALTVLADGQLCFIRVTAANTTNAPTFAPNGLTAHTITKLGGSVLNASDIPGSLAEVILRYNLANTRWELLNPAVVGSVQIANGAVAYAKIQNVTASRLLGNPTGGAAAPSEISLGAGLSFSGTSLVASIGPGLLPGFINGLTLSAAGSTGTFGIAAGVANDSTSASLMALASAYTKTTASWVVGSGNGALDTGSIANTTWYHVFLIQRPDTGVVDVLFSLSATSPTMPTNYTLFRRIGAMKTDGSAHWLAFTQTGNIFNWSVPVHDLSAFTVANTRSTIALSVPTSVVVKALMKWSLNATTGTSVNICAITETDAAVSTNTNTNLQAGNNSVAGGQFEVLTDTNRAVAVRAATATAATLDEYTYGWIDFRGVA